MRVITFMIKNRVLELLHGSQATNIEGVTRRMRGTAMERCTGPMAVVTKASGRTESSTA